MWQANTGLKGKDYLQDIDIDGTVTGLLSSILNKQAGGEGVEVSQWRSRLDSVTNLRVT